MILGLGKIIALFGAFFVVSIVFMMFGQGGGAIYVPMLLAFGLPLYKAAAVSQVLIIAATVSATLVFRKAKMLDWWLVLIVEPPPTWVPSWGVFSPLFPAMFSKLVFSVILLIGAYFMIRPLKERTAPILAPTWYHQERHIGEYHYSINLLVMVPVMISAGFVAGMLGVGGGLFKLPALVLLGCVPMKIAVGTSSLMIGVTALTGLFGHILVGHFDPKLAAILGIAVFVGAQIGARIGVGIDKKKHKKYFGYLLVFISIWMAYSAF